MRELEPGEYAPRYTPEQTAILRAQFAEYMATGIHRRFINAMDDILIGPPNPNSLFGIAARAEYPIRLDLERDLWADVSKNTHVTGYFLEQYDPITGEAIATCKYGDIVSTWVAFLDDSGNVVELDGDGKKSHFTDEDIEILFQHGQQLIAAGLDED